MTVAQKFLSKLSTDFVEKAETLDNDELKKRIVECERTLSDTDKSMKADAKLLAVKEEAKELGKVYKETKSEQVAMIAVYLDLLEGRGAV